MSDPRAAQPVGHLPPALPAEVFGLTDRLDVLAEKIGWDGLQSLLDLVDRRATVTITGDRIEVAGLTGRRSVPFKQLKSIEVSTPMAVTGQVIPLWRNLLYLLPTVRASRLLSLATKAAPLFRTDPEVVKPDDLKRPVLSRIRRVGPGLKLRGTTALVALVHPRLTERLLIEAERHSVPVVAKR